MTAEQTLYALAAVFAIFITAFLLVYAYVFGSWFIAAIGAMELAIAIFYASKWLEKTIEEDNN